MLSPSINASTKSPSSQNLVTPSGSIITTSSGTRPSAPIFGSSTNIDPEINQATIEMAREICKSARFKTRDWNIGYSYIFEGPDSEDDVNSDFCPDKRSKSVPQKDSSDPDLRDLPNLVVILLELKLVLNAVTMILNHGMIVMTTKTTCQLVTCQCPMLILMTKKRIVRILIIKTTTDNVYILALITLELIWMPRQTICQSIALTQMTTVYTSFIMIHNYWTD